MRDDFIKNAKPNDEIKDRFLHIRESLHTFKTVATCLKDESSETILNEAIIRLQNKSNITFPPNRKGEIENMIRTSYNTLVNAGKYKWLNTKKTNSDPELPNFHQATQSSNALFLKQKEEIKKFDVVFDTIKRAIPSLNANEVIKIFTDAKAKDGYTNKITDTFKPTPEEKKFSVEFQKLCLNNGITSPNNTEVGLRTKRFVDEFESQEKMEEYIQSKWNRWRWLIK